MRFVFILLLVVGVVQAKRGAGPYLGGGFGIASIKDGGYYNLKKKSAKGYMLYGGAYINDYLSVELEYIDSFAFVKQSSNKQINFSFFNVNTQLHYPFSLYEESFDIYMKFGAGFVSQNGSGHTLVYGLGGAYRIDKRYAVRAGYNYFHFGIDVNRNGAVDKNIAVGYFFGSFEVQF